MGPSIKFVLAIVDAFSNKKNGGQFFSAKKTKPGGGGPGGGLVKNQTFAAFFFDPFPKVLSYLTSTNLIGCCLPWPSDIPINLSDSNAMQSD